MAKKKQWNELSTGQRVGVVALTAVQVTLAVAAYRDISKRDERELTASKTAWRLITMIDIVGPLTYFLAGRRV
ncbi:PLDc N-terminal domain-containing protein [Paramicrobacterium agarici]|uniref:Phospholipase D-like protein n=1 Tax=Paramicrobacterium agarici TaxID=630514 RepID=A0A2A9DV49_9MICO|nr:PLDc N-terminal domain-containing protein [Microbacterium agarici]PFG30025.1 phospholipase D-like protein [Microbacterium agarici]